MQVKANPLYFYQFELSHYLSVRMVSNNHILIYIYSSTCISTDWTFPRNEVLQGVYIYVRIDSL